MSQDKLVAPKSIQTQILEDMMIEIKKTNYFDESLLEKLSKIIEMGYLGSETHLMKFYQLEVNKNENS